MREIKFRAWDKEIKRMLCVLEIDFLEETVGTYRRYYNRFNNLVLMQFTGLEDKNGREIYEGDIVKFDPQSPRSEELPNPRYGEMGEIFFDIGSFAVRPIDRKREGLEFFLDELGEWVVVGNIYENKELLDE